MNNQVINWLLEDDNPAVKYRTETEILGQSSDAEKALSWMFNKIPKDWYETKGLWYFYYITALAECGLTHNDIKEEHFKRAYEYIKNEFSYSCSDFMVLISLIKLGFNCDEVICGIKKEMLPDGGFLCKTRLNKFEYTPKSCYKANIYALMLLAECHKKSITVDFNKPLIDYFLNRNIFYKNNKIEFVISGKEGSRIIDTFHPFEPMRIGIHNIVESFCAIGYGNDEKLKEAWCFLDKYDDNGKFILSNTLTKSYLPKEKVGQPSK